MHTSFTKPNSPRHPLPHSSSLNSINTYLFSSQCAVTPPSVLFFSISVSYLSLKFRGNYHSKVPFLSKWELRVIFQLIKFISGLVDAFPHQFPHGELVFFLSVKVGRNNGLCHSQVTFYKLYEITMSGVRSLKWISFTFVSAKSPAVAAFRPRLLCCCVLRACNLPAPFFFPLDL